MAGYERLFVGCRVTLDEGRRLCGVSLDESVSVEAARLSDQQIRYVFDYVMKLAAAYASEDPTSFTNARQAEQKALKELVDVVSGGRSDENYRKYYKFWKFLHELRVEGMAIEKEEGCITRMIKAGMTNILLFRTGGFNRRFFQKTKGSLEAVRKWNQLYYPYIEEVQMRVLDERRNDFSGKIDLHQLAVRSALKTADHYWVGGIRELNQEEQLLYKVDFNSASSQKKASLQCTRDVLRDGICGESDLNNAIYVCVK